PLRDDAQGLARAHRQGPGLSARRRARCARGVLDAAANAGHAGQGIAVARRRRAGIEANAQLLARAQSLLRAGRAAEAERLYRQLLQHTHVIDFEYDDWLKGIAQCYRVLGRAREAGYVYLYLHAFDRAAEMFPAAAAPVDAARVRELEARRIGGEGGNKL